MANQVHVLWNGLSESFLYFKQSGEVAHLQDTIQCRQNVLLQVSQYNDVVLLYFYNVSEKSAKQFANFVHPTIEHLKSLPA